MDIFFVTHNEFKYMEAKQIAQEYDISVEWFNLEYQEIQENNLTAIANTSCLQILRDNENLVDKNFFLEDAGLFVESLNGFPGPYSSYVLHTIGNDGILQLMKKEENRYAYFKSVVAYHSGGKIHNFQGITDGTIIHEIKGDKGFGFDPIFRPLESEFTFAEMTLKTKNLYSHRQKSLREMFNSLTTFANK
ncbi:MAG: XTP/dITP diphosphatase [Candidatus Heimdallarchaeota archaeon]|nr:XTP/dITP diphosphatase [Candidatus Heimdallarchaeota archaeon]MCK4954753.1 XTP/dITP diphosphatase [Candidatus Heimdallarchaeota archaeon]